ncbi:MAG TPA: hypothetical protein PK530_20930, partial [Anaerolineales bacterium]|nr:hypothetical protein [Anaerolineales bacterium]
MTTQTILFIEQLKAKAETLPKKELKALVEVQVNRLLADQPQRTLTPDILELAEALYHLPVVMTIAETVGISFRVLQLSLVKEREFRCRGCGSTYLEEASPNKNHEYKGQCPACTQNAKEADLRALKLSRGISGAFPVDQIMASMESTMIIKTIAKGGSPLTVKEFTDVLEALVTSWHELTKGNLFTPYLEQEPLPSGCMMCGRTPVYLCLIDPQYPIQLSAKYLHPSPTSYYQIIMEIIPSEFWERVPFVPVRQRPILMLCDYCRVGFLASHPIQINRPIL